MGGEYTARIYKGKLDRKEIVARVAQDTEEMGYESGQGGYSGTWVEKGGGVDFCQTKFKSESDADTWLCDNNGKWDNVGACYFEVVGTKAQMTKLEKLNDKLSKLQSAHTLLLEAKELIANSGYVKLKANKSKTKACKVCGSSIAVSYLKSSDCPVCTKSLLSTSETERMAKATVTANVKIKKSYDKIQTETKIINEFKAEVGIKQGWVVGGWCSC